jgi:hypothetical protein
LARENLSWGEERIANELLLKLGLRVSPRTVDTPQNLSPDAEMFSWPLTYPASLDKSRATLTVRKYRGDPPIVIPATDSEYFDASTIGLAPRKKPFERGMLYQFVYLATDPKVIGIGFAAVRDFISAPRDG